MSIPTIPPVTSPDRPTWSVMIPARDAERFLPSTLESVLAAGLPVGSQIEVVDDGSTDATPDIAARFAGRGVTYHRTPEAGGATANFNECIGRASGHLVHILHADDEVLPGFYAATGAALTGSAAVAAVVRTAYIDEAGAVTTATRAECPTGIWVDAIRTLVVSNRIRPPGIAVRRDAYEAVGGFRQDLHHAADWEMWVRLGMHGPLWFEDRILARYRVHRSQDTAERVADAGNIAERVAALEMIAGQLPPDERRRALRHGLLYSSVFAGRTALRLARRTAWRAAGKQSLASLRCAVAAITATPPGGRERRADQTREPGMTGAAGLRPAFVILTTGSRPDQLAASVESALAQGSTGPVLVVAQGASVDIPVDIAGRAGVEVLRLDENVGIPGGRDAGVRAVDADVVFFLDDDARYGRPDVAAGVLGDMAARPQLAAESLRIVDEEGLTLRRHVPRIGGGSAGRSGATTTFLGGACAVRRASYVAVGGYHAAYWYGHEEMDLAWRFLDAGWQVRYDGAPAVIHPHTPITAADRSRWSLLGRNRVWLARRNLPHPIDWAHTVVWLGIGLARAGSAADRRSYRSGWWSGWQGRVDRRPMSWATVLRMCRLGRPPVV